MEPGMDPTPRPRTSPLMQSLIDMVERSNINESNKPKGNKSRGKRDRGARVPGAFEVLGGPSDSTSLPAREPVPPPPCPFELSEAADRALSKVLSAVDTSISLDKASTKPLPCVSAPGRPDTETPLSHCPGSAERLSGGS